MRLNQFKKTAILCCLSSIAFSASQPASQPAKITHINSHFQQDSHWQGPYLGASTGWAWSSFRASSTPFGAQVTTDIQAQSFPSSQMNGGIFAGQLGFNQTFNTFLIGFEGDISDVNLNGSKQATFRALDPDAIEENSTNGLMITQKINWLSSARGRIGAIWQSGLLYFTAGGAWQGVSTYVMENGNVTPIDGWNVSPNGNFSKTKSGYVLGAGYERLIAKNWTVRGEYLYYGFNGSNIYPLNFPVATIAQGSSNYVNIATNNNNINALRLGVNYRLS
jgi:hypothetical protein